MGNCSKCKLGKSNNAKRCDISKPYGCCEKWVSRVSKMNDAQVIVIYFKFQSEGKIPA